MTEETKDIIERPKICLLDLLDEGKLLEAEGYNVYSGSLGSIVDIPNKSRNDSHPCLLNYDYPSNLHEFDIIIIDQAPGDSIEYIISWVKK